jgi:hypothetical protein
MNKKERVNGVNDTGKEQAIICEKGISYQEKGGGVWRNMCKFWPPVQSHVR